MFDIIRIHFIYTTFAYSKYYFELLVSFFKIRILELLQTEKIKTF